MCPEAVKAERYDRLMRHQQAISAELLATRIGKTIEVLVDEVDAEGAIARSHWDAPEIDGNVFLEGETTLKPGDRLRVTVERQANTISSRGASRQRRPAGSGRLTMIDVAKSSGPPRETVANWSWLRSGSAAGGHRRSASC